MNWKIFLTIGGLIGVVIVAYLYIAPLVEEYQYKQMRNNLAEKLGVKIEDYPPEEFFPYDYFASVLKPGMDISEVHKIVIGYKKVFQCEFDNGNWYGELYYYYSVKRSNKHFIGVEIFYDDLGKFDVMGSADDSSGDIHEDRCENGLLEIKK